ncbi:MAG TPA: hypothetical protein VK447_19860 [Myxococcaceae bacterium]|nr:hypothetical protein [Myxococcaceae bacterium]
MSPRPSGTLLLLAALVSACATTPATTPASSPGATAAPRFSIRLTHLPGDEGWEVHYRLPAPLRSVLFERRGFGLRQQHWTVLSPAGARLEPRENTDALVAADGGVLEEVRIRVAPHAVKPEKGYQPLVPYARGGVLAFTGQLNVQPDPEPKAPFENRFALVPLPGERVVVLGRAYEGGVEDLLSPEGTYAFFGTVSPLSTEHLTAVVDPGLPSWLWQTVSDTLPRLFQLYAERTGYPLTFKPTVFVSYGEEPRPRSIVTNGGTLPDVVQMELRLGSAYQAENDPVAADRLFQLLAHEAAHLWNGQLIAHDVEGGDWMHEGSADAFAYRALRDLGHISEPAYRARLDMALGQCLLGLQGKPLRAAPREGRHRASYACGSTLQLLAELSARKKDPRADIFSLWRGVFDAAGKSGRYDEPMLLGAFARGGVSERRIAEMKALLDGPTQHADAVLVSALQEEGVSLRRSCDRAPADHQQLFIQRALGHALASECGPNVRVRPEEGGAVVAATCKTLGDRPKVTSAAGLAVSPDAFALYAAIAQKCEQDGAVLLGVVGRSEPVRVPCGKLLPAQPPCVFIEKLP